MSDFRRINEAEAASLDTLLRAAANDHVALVVARERATGDERVLLAAIGFEDGEYLITPFAVMIDGDPFELFDEPEVPADA